MCIKPCIWFEIYLATKPVCLHFLILDYCSSRDEGLYRRENRISEKNIEKEIFFCYHNGLFKKYIFLKEVAKDKVNRRLTVMTFRWYPFSQ